MRRPLTRASATWIRHYCHGTRTGLGKKSQLVITLHCCYVAAITSEEDDPRLLLEFKAEKIRLGCYSVKRDVKIGDLSCGKRMVSFNISKGGCEECWGNECYEFVMERNLMGNLRLSIEEYIQCRCGGEEERCEETSFFAYET